MAETLITARGLKRYYKLGGQIVKALDGVDLDVQQGEMLVLMGPSGSGKSTLLNVLGGLDHADDGAINVDGLEISDLDANGLAAYRQKMIGFVFQSFNLIATMTAQENVEYPMIFARVPLAERRARARSLLERVGLGDRMHHKPTELSGGQQQRVAMARSLVNSPRILLGDEPTGNLDSKTGLEILEMLQQLNQQEQTIILVSHDSRLANFATRTIHMLDGRIADDNHTPTSISTPREEQHS